MTDPPLHLSRNEAEALALKAARGAGMDWGMAEEAGFAVGWLQARGIDGASALLALMRAMEGGSWADARPRPDAAGWQPGQGALCPIALGTALGDYADLPQTEMRTRPLRLGPVLQPLLLLPHLVAVAAQKGHALRMEAGGGPLMLVPTGEIDGDLRALAAQVCNKVTLSCETRAIAVNTLSAALAPVPRMTCAGLEAFAHQTTVPASATSRTGAGARDEDD